MYVKHRLLHIISVIKPWLFYMRKYLSVKYSLYVCNCVDIHERLSQLLCSSQLYFNDFILRSCKLFYIITILPCTLYDMVMECDIKIIIKTLLIQQHLTAVKKLLVYLPGVPIQLLHVGKCLTFYIIVNGMITVCQQELFYGKSRKIYFDIVSTFKVWGSVHLLAENTKNIKILAEYFC